MAASIRRVRCRNEAIAKPNANGSHIFGNLDELIERMLIQLPMRSLNLCARVCKRWNEAVQRIKRRRLQISWFTCTDPETLSDYVQEKMQLLSSQPSTAIVFISNEMSTAILTSSRGRRRSKRAKKRISVIDYLQQVLPPSCDLIGTLCDGVVGTSLDGRETEEWEEGGSLSALLLPSSPAYSVHRFSTDHVLAQRLADLPPGGATLRDLTGVPSHCHARLVLVFFTATEETGELADWLARAYGGRAAVAGGWVNALLPFHNVDAQTSEEDVTASGVVFCGAGLCVASVVLDVTVCTRDAVERALGRLRETHIGARPHVAFMFTCVGRGASHYQGESNVETSVFRKMFPKTPLLGFFGNGEVGCDFLPDFSRPHVDFSIVEDGEIPELRHSYSSVFVLLSLDT